MVRWLLGLLLLSAVLPATAGELELQLRATHGEWGRPLRGHLVYTGEAEPLAVDFSPWEPWVVVDPDYQEQDEDAQGHPVIRQALRLFPRRTGRWQLPSLQAGDAVSAPVWVDIAGPAYDGHAIRVDTRYPEGPVWTREARRLSVSVTTGDPVARVLVEPPAGQQVRFTPLAARREAIREGGVAQHVFHFDWWVQAGAAGHLRLQPPALRYRKHGRDARRLYLPLLEVEVEPLPEYIPPTTPVGRPTMQSRIEGDDWWVSVSAPGPLDTGLPWLTQQLATIAGVPAARLPVEASLVQGPDGPRSVLSYRVPLPRWLVPGLGDTTVQLRYFDPQTGQLAQLEHALPAAWRWPAWLSLAVAAGLLFATWPLLRLSVAWLRRLRARLGLVAALRRCDDPQQLRQRLVAALAVRTLGDWAASPGWGRHRAAAQGLARTLDAACFRGDGTVDFSALRQRAETLAWHLP